VDNRHIDPLRRIGQADEAWAADGNEPTAFHLHHSGEGPEIDHPRWDRSWSTPSEQTIDDLEELGYLRVAPHDNKARSFDLTMAGRAESALQRRRSGAEVGGQPPIAVEPTISVAETENVVASPPSPVSTGDLPDAEIFVVHGHSRKSEVALFLASVTKTQPVILDERAGKGRTIIEKFEQESGESDFAVVLLTADDVGRSAADEELELSARARQNVIFELGYFIGKLGRDRVLALYDNGVEQPSDYGGVEYISFAGDWKADLIRELAAAGFSIYPPSPATR
jgi:predicted nucleotide-binding protein